MALRSGKRTRPHAHSTPSYPEIRKHQLGDWTGYRRKYMYPRPAVPEENANPSDVKRRAIDDVGDEGASHLSSPDAIGP